MNPDFVLNSEGLWFPSWRRDLLTPLEALWGTRFPGFLYGPHGKALVPIQFLWKTTLLLRKRHYGKQSTQPAWVYTNNFISNPLMNAMEKYFVSYIVVHGHPNFHRFWKWLQVIWTDNFRGSGTFWNQHFPLKSLIWLCIPKTAGGYWISLLF